MWITFSKSWGQDDYRWNYCGGDYNFKNLADFMEFYGIEEARIIGKDSYFENDKEIACYEYEGFATKELDRLKKHFTH